MESPEANAVLSASQEADFEHLVDIFGDEQPIETLRQHLIEHRNEPDRVNAVTNAIFSQIDASAAGRDNEACVAAASSYMTREDKFATLVDMFPDMAFDELQSALDDCDDDLQKVVDKLSIPNCHTSFQTQRQFSDRDIPHSLKRPAESAELFETKQIKLQMDQSASESALNIDQSASSSTLDIDQSSHTPEENNQSDVSSDYTPIIHPQSDVAPKPHVPEEIADRVCALMKRFPEANPAALFHRLEECQNLDRTEKELIAELVPPIIEPEVDPDDMPGPSHQDIVSPNRASPVSKLGAFLSKEEKGSLITIVQVFPDVDPNYVFEQIAQQQKSKEEIIEEMTKNSGYPKMRHRREKEKIERRRQELLDNDHFKMEEYLRIFNDPETYFTDQQRTVSELYIRHAKVHLMNIFPNMRKDFLSRQLELHGNHILPTIRIIREGNFTIRGTSIRGKRRGRGRGGAWERKPRTEHEQWPTEIDEQFFRELQYIHHMDEIKDFKQQTEAEREEKISNARENGLLVECQCCFNDECLNDEMISCQVNEEHKFCKECVRQHAETQVSEGHHRIICMAGDCKEFISFKIVQSLLRPNEVNLILRRWQQDELRNAQLDNMESCPSCDFAMIIENTNDKVFKCQNPDCLKETCRECQEPNHIPIKCDEVEKDAETQMRIFVENKMAEAMIRICPKCKNRLIKSEGCNKMRCPCGSAMCYVCRQPLPQNNPYSHFQNQGGPAGNASCPVETTMDQVHADVAETAGRQAREEYLRDHPELHQMKDIQVNDLVQRNQAQRGIPAPQMMMGFPQMLADNLGQMMQQFFPPAPHQTPPQRGRVRGRGRARGRRGRRNAPAKLEID